MSANRGAWVGDWAFRCHETERPVFLFANNATIVAREVLEEAVFFANHQSPIAAANEETRLRRVMLAPYGDWPNSRGLQRFQKPDAEEIVKEFSNVVNKLLNPASWLGLPWYEGHPDHPDFRGKPGHTRATAVGRIKSLEAGDDGLYANVKFNEDGERLISNESYHGHSVNWFLTRDKQAANAFRPFRLKSVGFTNEPNIPVPAVTLANGAPIGNKNAGGKHKAWFISGHQESYDFHKPKAEYYEGLSHLGEEYKNLAKFHGDRAAFHQSELERLNSSANSSPISRFRAMAQMRQMANGAPVGNKNAAGQHEHNEDMKFAQREYSSPAYAQTRRAEAATERAERQKKGVRGAEVHYTASFHHGEAASAHRDAAEHYRTIKGKDAEAMAAEHEKEAEDHDDLAKFHHRTSGKWRGMSDTATRANSQSRFSVMRGMREMANNKV